MARQNKSHSIILSEAMTVLKQAVHNTSLVLVFEWSSSWLTFWVQKPLVSNVFHIVLNV